jgi:hypothetical protein
MKGAATVILMLLFSLQTFSKWVCVLDYQLNKEYIANNLCINKTKRECKGKCQLLKKLNETESNTKGPGQGFVKDFGNAAYCKQELETTLLSHDTPGPKYYSTYIFKKTSAINPAIFHPPSV